MSPPTWIVVTFPLLATKNKASLPFGKRNVICLFEKEMALHDSTATSQRQ